MEDLFNVFVKVAKNFVGRDDHSSSSERKLFGDIKIVCNDGVLLYNKLILLLMSSGSAWSWENLLNTNKGCTCQEEVIILPDDSISTLKKQLNPDRLEETNADDTIIENCQSFVNDIFEGSDDCEIHETGSSEEENSTSVNVNSGSQSIRNANVVVCEQCGRQFKYQQDLRKHFYKSHYYSFIEESRFECSKCSKTFIDKNEFARHNLSHSSIARYKCEYCPSKFKYKKNLLQHWEDQHSDNAKEYVCKICHASFKRKSSFKRHSDSHNKVTKFKCSHCEASFIRKDNYNRHLLKCK